jgi:hypothetical protein
MRPYSARSHLLRRLAQAPITGGMAEDEKLINAFAQELAGQVEFATEFRIPCPDPADPSRPASAPVLRPEPLIVRKCTTSWADHWPDGWSILNPNLEPGDHVWTGERWEYRGQVYGGTIYQWTRDQALALAPELAAAETARYETWLTEMRSSR